MVLQMGFIYQNFKYFQIRFEEAYVRSLRYQALFVFSLRQEFFKKHEFNEAQEDPRRY